MWGSTKETVLIRMAASESVCVSSCVLHLEVGMGDCLVCVDLVCGPCVCERGVPVCVFAF